jgi:hypothetical protein
MDGGGEFAWWTRWAQKLFMAKDTSFGSIRAEEPVSLTLDSTVRYCNVTTINSTLKLVGETLPAKHGCCFSQSFALRVPQGSNNDLWPQGSFRWYEYS